MNNKDFSRALKNREHIYGTTIISQSPLWPGVIASMEIDFVFIDTEHIPFNRETVSWLCRYYNDVQVAPLVRIPSLDPIQACMAIDAGAAGIVAPYVETVDQLKELAGAVKYNPIKGKKLAQILNDTLPDKDNLSEYLRNRNAHKTLIANIESTEAIDNLDRLLQVKELDGLLIGPHDLSCSLGIPEQYEHPLFLEAVNEIFTKAKEENVSAGIIMFYSSGFEREKEWAAKANLILHSNDVNAIKETIGKEIEELKSVVQQ